MIDETNDAAAYIKGPAWAIELILETIAADMRSKAFSAELRADLERAWDACEAGQE